MNSYEVKEYPDGAKYVVVNNFDSDIYISINSYEDLWILNQLKDIYDFNNVPIDLHIRSLIDSQADRRFNKNESSGLKLVCKFINALKFNSVSVFHPHNPEVVEALIDNVQIIDNEQFIRGVFSFIVKNYYDYDSLDMEDNLILMSTDAGGFKPLMKLCDKLDWTGETFSASKSRKYENGKSNLIQQVDREDFNGKSILIIDDICVYGGTFVGLYDLLKKKNVGKIFLAVSHITVQKPNSLLNRFDKVFTTNSKNLSYDLNNVKILGYL